MIDLGKPQKLLENCKELKLRFPQGIGNASSTFNFEKLLPITYNPRQLVRIIPARHPAPVVGHSYEQCMSEKITKQYANLAI